MDNIRVWSILSKPHPKKMAFLNTFTPKKHRILKPETKPRFLMHSWKSLSIITLCAALTHLATGRETISNSIHDFVDLELFRLSQ